MEPDALHPAFGSIFVRIEVEQITVLNEARRIRIFAVGAGDDVHVDQPTALIHRLEFQDRRHRISFCVHDLAEHSDPAVAVLRLQDDDGVFQHIWHLFDDIHRHALVLP